MLKVIIYKWDNVSLCEPFNRFLRSAPVEMTIERTGQVEESGSLALAVNKGFVGRTGCLEDRPALIRLGGL